MQLLLVFLSGSKLIQEKIPPTPKNQQNNVQQKLQCHSHFQGTVELSETCFILAL